MWHFDSNRPEINSYPFLHYRLLSSSLPPISSTTSFFHLPSKSICVLFSIKNTRYIKLPLLQIHMTLPLVTRQKEPKLLVQQKWACWAWEGPKKDTFSPPEFPFFLWSSFAVYYYINSRISNHVVYTGHACRVLWSFYMYLCFQNRKKKKKERRETVADATYLIFEQVACTFHKLAASWHGSRVTLLTPNKRIKCTSSQKWWHIWKGQTMRVAYSVEGVESRRRRRSRRNHQNFIRPSFMFFSYIGLRNHIAFQSDPIPREHT